MLNFKSDERPELSDAENRLIYAYRQLTPDDQRQVLRLASLLAEHAEGFEKRGCAKLAPSKQLTI